MHFFLSHILQIGTLYNLTVASLTYEGFVDQLSVEPYVVKSTEKIFASESTLQLFLNLADLCCILELPSRS